MTNEQLMFIFYTLTEEEHLNLQDGDVIILNLTGYVDYVAEFHQHRIPFRFFRPL